MAYPKVTDFLSHIVTGTNVRIEDDRTDELYFAGSISDYLDAEVSKEPLTLLHSRIQNDVLYIRVVKEEENRNSHTSTKEVATIKHAVDHLLDCELTEENGWSEEDIASLQKVSTEAFEIVFK